MFAKLAISTTFLLAALNGIANADEINPVVGKSADYTIRSADLERLVAAQPVEIQDKLRDEPTLKVYLVKQLLTQKAVVALARKEGFDKKPDVVEQLSHVIDDYIAREYLIKVVAAKVTITDDELKKYYKENTSKFLITEQIKVRHIFIEASKEMMAKDKNTSFLKAETLLERLKKGEDFAKVAQEASDDNDSAKKGGELGTLSPGATSSEEFEKAAFALKSGDISGVVETPYGYHIIKVDERREKRTATFDEAREYIRKKLQSDYEATKLQEFMETASKNAGVEVFADRISGKKDRETGNDKQQ